MSRNWGQRTISLLERIGEKVGRLPIGETRGATKTSYVPQRNSTLTPILFIGFDLSMISSDTVDYLFLGTVVSNLQVN